MPAGQSPLRARQGVPPGRLVIGAVGRLSPEKAFNNLIHATHRLLGQGLDVELWIAGEGDSRSDLEALIKHLGLDGRVRLLGFCADTIELYHALDLFVLSSLREGLPNVVLEAMAMEVPVVSTRVAGVPKLIDDGQTGLLVPVGDIEALTAAMQRLLAEPDLRRQLADAGRRLIERRFSFRERMLQEKAIYDRLLAVPLAAPTA
jgi:glycosyltransferase involved in cell wall biosynthesis